MAMKTLRMSGSTSGSGARRRSSTGDAVTEIYENVASMWRLMVAWRVVWLG
jgi:hypothetical protein